MPLSAEASMPSTRANSWINQSASPGRSVATTHRAGAGAEAGQLEPAERGFVVALGGVDADVARPQLLRHAQGPGRVGGEHVVVQAEVGAVGQGDTLVLVVERNDDDHRAE